MFSMMLFSPVGLMHVFVNLDSVRVSTSVMFANHLMTVGDFVHGIPSIGTAPHPMQASVDEYFFQDQWEGPTTLSDKLLLLIGDPLERVEVPFYPSTLVQNWELRPLS